MVTKQQEYSISTRGTNTSHHHILRVQDVIYFLQISLFPQLIASQSHCGHWGERSSLLATPCVSFFETAQQLLYVFFFKKMFGSVGVYLAVQRLPQQRLKATEGANIFPGSMSFRKKEPGYAKQTWISQFLRALIFVVPGEPIHRSCNLAMRIGRLRQFYFSCTQQIDSRCRFCNLPPFADSAFVNYY